LVSKINNFGEIAMELSIVRESLKDAIDTWPEQVVFAVQEFAIFESQRFSLSSKQENHLFTHDDDMITEPQADLNKRMAAYKNLEKYFGRIERDLDYNSCYAPAVAGVQFRNIEYSPHADLSAVA
jgi:hypothetical protein